MHKHLFLFLSAFLFQLNAQAQPPYGGTIFIDSNVILTTDPTTFTGCTFLKQETRSVYDRRVEAYVNTPVYVFKITFSDGLSSEAQVNTEFGSQSNANTEAIYYSKVIGQLPYCLRKDVQTITIHKGLKPFGGGGFDILIHTDQAADYLKSGILEETIVHEATHTSMDAYYAASAGWIAAQKSDPTFISTYAKDNPTREDVAESFLPWIMVRQCTNRIQQKDRDSILKAIPARLDFFDHLPIKLLPVCVTGQKAAIQDVSTTHDMIGFDAHSKTIQLLEKYWYDVTNIKVGDMNGRMMTEHHTVINPIDASSWAPGIYILQLTHLNKQTSTLKINIF